MKRNQIVSVLCWRGEKTRRETEETRTERGESRHETKPRVQQSRGGMRRRAVALLSTNLDDLLSRGKKGEKKRKRGKG